MLARRLRIFQMIAGLVLVLGVMWIAPARIESALAAESGAASTGTRLMDELIEKFGASDLINGVDMRVAPEGLPPSIAELYQAHTLVDIDVDGLASTSRSSAPGRANRHQSNRVTDRAEKARSRTRGTRRFRR